MNRTRGEVLVHTDTACKKSLQSFTELFQRKYRMNSAFFVCFVFYAQLFFYQIGVVCYELGLVCVVSSFNDSVLGLFLFSIGTIADKSGINKYYQ